MQRTPRSGLMALALAFAPVLASAQFTVSGQYGTANANGTIKS